jgi:hypothetical protein
MRSNNSLRPDSSRRQLRCFVQGLLEDIQHLAVRCRRRQASGIALLQVNPRYVLISSGVY